MAAEVGIEAPESSDDTPAPGEVAKVEVGDGESMGSKIESAGGEDGDGGVPDHRRLPLLEERHLGLEIQEEDWGEDPEYDLERNISPN